MMKKAKTEPASRLASKPRAKEQRDQQAATGLPTSVPERKPSNPRTSPKAPTKPQVRRRAQRAALWPGSPHLHFDRQNSRDVGFTTIPRSLSIVCAIIQHTTDAGTAKVYYDLWCRSFDEGFVEIHDERVLALSAGFKHGTRHVRTWQSKMRQLESLGFLLIRKRATTDFGYALLIHPHLAVSKLRANGTHRVPEHLWELFDERLREIGAQPIHADALDDEFASAQDATRAERRRTSRTAS